MRASINWLRELVRQDITAGDAAERFIRGGLEVERIERVGDVANVVVAEIRAKSAHPKKDKLTLVEAWDGETMHSVVCGAPNVPAIGGRVLLARIGTTMPNGMKIEERAVAGASSRGMLVSEAELGIGDDADGIMILDASAKPGAFLRDAVPASDDILELSLTPNRPDCLGHIGLARELAVSLDVPFVVPTAPELRRSEGAVQVTIDDAHACTRYAAVVIDGVRIGPSSLMVRARLHALGVRPISNVVDATNLTLLEWGHPTHAFDAGKLDGGEIVVRRARAHEPLATLDGVARTLDPADLVIADAKNAAALAGVIGGQASAVSTATSKVLLEIAWFEPRVIRRDAKRHDLHTDASHRFERGVDPNAVPLVARALTARVLEYAGGAVVAHTDAHPSPRERTRIRLRPARASSLIGLVTPRDQIAKMLTGLGCDVTPNGEALDVLAPTWRPDFTREVDLIEEIARLGGYDQIPTEVPRLPPVIGLAAPMLPFLERIRDLAAASGLVEARTLSLTSLDDRAVLGLDAATVVLDNPLSSEQSAMRVSLVPGLLRVASHAARHQIDRTTMFEIGNVFSLVGTDASTSSTTERPMLAFLLHGMRRSTLGDEVPFDFFDGKGLVSRIFEGAELSVRRCEATTYTHPQRSADLVLRTKRVGVLGELHPDVADRFGLGRAVVAEIDLAAWFDLVASERPRQARPLPKFPASSRDVALVLDERVESSRAIDVLRAAGAPHAESVELFDVFRGDAIGAGQKSLAFRVTYRSEAETLTATVIDELHARATRAACELLGARPRT